MPEDKLNKNVGIKGHIGVWNGMMKEEERNIRQKDGAVQGWPKDYLEIYRVSYISFTSVSLTVSTVCSLLVIVCCVCSRSEKRILNTRSKSFVVRKKS